jgi:hypothetical protein
LDGGYPALRVEFSAPLNFRRCVRSRKDRPCQLAVASGRRWRSKAAHIRPNPRRGAKNATAMAVVKRAAKVGCSGGFISSTMMVIMTANTASEKEANRSVLSLC